MKIVGIMGFIGRLYCCIASESHFGKSSLYDVVHGITDKSPVFKPRSVPGVLNHISGNGNVVFDETHRCKKEVRDIIEEFALQIGGGKSMYINGALKAFNTKQTYTCVLQSITFLYNNTANYKEPEKDYFEYIFSNNKAIDDRFLKLKFEGTLTERFSKNFNIKKVAEENKMYYVKIAKELLYLQELKQTNAYERRWSTDTVLTLKGRRRFVLDDILWLVDMYSENQKEYNSFVKLLDEAVLGYKEMINALEGTGEVEEEVVE